MESIEAAPAILVVCIALFGIIIALLPVILFFKIWDMTNDVAAIRRLLEQAEEHSANQQPAPTGEHTLQKPTTTAARQSEFWRLDKVPFRREAKDGPAIKNSIQEHQER